ncbi:MAG: M1 family metallopeptidase [Bacteroidetes bacterium]|nr:M1 family metallopeptidase [Bacteroidota bacterium]
MIRIVIVFFMLLLTLPSLAQKSGYFQQDVDYKISAELFPETKTLKGDLVFTYKNNSAQTLNEIWFHLYPNAFKDETTPFAKQMVQMKRWGFTESKPEEKGWMTAEFSLDGKKLETALKPDAIDEMKVSLPKPLKPGESVTLAISFETKFPKVFSRIGYDKNNFGGTQWYPKVVVYDEKGWHPDSYLDYGEFYGEYGTWDVSLTLPKSYVIDATGILTKSDSEVAFMDSLAMVLEKYYEISGSEEKEKYRKEFKENIEKNRDWTVKKTVRYKAENVQDFAWFASESFLVRKSTGVNGVIGYALIQPENWDGWKDAAVFATDAIKYYSGWIGKYPHPKASVVDGALDAGGGMEYPMITVISQGAVKGLTLLDQVITHEVGHNFFQGIIGTNEREYAWMDEGINTFYEMRTLNAKYGKNNSFISNPDSMEIPFVNKFLRPLGSTEFYSMMCQALFWRNSDLPNNIPAADQMWNGNMVITYQKGGLMLDALKWYLGEPKFDKAMQSYYEKWKFKHPAPEDFYSAISESAGEDLTWFFNQWVNTTAINDFVVADFSTEKTGSGFKTTVTPENKGNMVMPAPVYLITEKGDTLIAKWDPRKEKTVTFEHESVAKTVGINLGLEVLELDNTNNKQWPEFNFNWFLAIPKIDAYDINVFPVLAWEPEVDKFQVGAGFWSGNPITGKNLQFATVYYGTESGDIGYRYHYKSRLPRFLLNYMDYGFSMLDQEGFKRQEVYSRLVHSKRNYESSAELSLGRFTTYDDSYMNKLIYQETSYNLVSLKLKAKNSIRSYLATWHAEVSKSFKSKDTDADFSRFETSFSYRQNFTSELKLAYRTYFGSSFGTVPNQETIFAGGTTDPRGQQWGLSRAGGFSVLHGISDGSGMDMPGYGAGKHAEQVNGRTGWSNKLTLFVPGGFSIFADAGNVYKNLDEFDAGNLIYDAGIGYRVGPAVISVPFWVSDPVKGESNTEFRMHVTINVMGDIVSMIAD